MEADITSLEDLSIGIMNLISAEEHLFFSFGKTGDAKYLKMLKRVREARKRMMEKFVRPGKAEEWCLTKHLLASSMRLMEVGTKYMDEKPKLAEEMFRVSFRLYVMAFEINYASHAGKAKKGKFHEIIKSLLECCRE